LGPQSESLWHAAPTGTWLRSREPQPFALPLEDPLELLVVPPPLPPQLELSEEPPELPVAVVGPPDELPELDVPPNVPPEPVDELV
jgi:hypothetical protein